MTRVYSIHSITEAINDLNPKYKKASEIEGLQTFDFIKDVYFEFRYDPNPEYKDEHFVLVDVEMSDTYSYKSLNDGFDQVIDLLEEIADSECYKSRNNKWPLKIGSMEIGWEPFQVTKDQWNCGLIGKIKCTVAVDSEIVEE